MAFNWGQASTLVAANLGKLASGVVDSTISTLLPIWAAMMQEEILQDRNYWFLRAQGTLPTQVGVQNYPLPTNFTEGLTLYFIFTGTPAKAFLELRQLYTRQEIIRLFAPIITSADYAQPTHFFVGTGQFELWPAPDQVYTLGADFWGDMTVPDGTNNSFTNYLITHFPTFYVDKLTEIGFRYLQEWEDASLWAAKVEKDLKDLRARHVARMLGSEFVLRPRTDVYGNYFKDRGDQWITWMWGT